MKYVHALTSLRSSTPLTENVTWTWLNRVKCMQKAVNIILTLIWPTPSPPPSVLLPWPCHLDHALSHCQLDLWKIGKECALESFISKHVVQTNCEIQTGFVQKPLNISPDPFCYAVTNNLA